MNYTRAEKNKTAVKQKRKLLTSKKERQKFLGQHENMRSDYFGNTYSTRIYIQYIPDHDDKLVSQRSCAPLLTLTSEAGLGKIALIGELLVPPLLGGLILFSFWRRLQNQTRITSFSILS